MGIIFRYISKELYSTLIGIMVVLLIIFMSNQFVHYLRVAASGLITMSAVLQLMALQVPFLMAYLVPLALYLCILIVFGRLYLDHEMTVMSACGVKPVYLLGVVLSVGVVIATLVGFLMLWLQPILDTKRVQIFYESAAKATVEKAMPKRFQSIGDMVFYADEVERAQLKMHNIFFARRLKPEPDGSRKWDITIAKTAQEQYLDNSHFMRFQDGFRYNGLPGRPDYQVISYQTYGARLTESMSKHTGWPSNASTASLWPERHDKRVAAELHWRMAMPASAIVLSFLAFPLSRVNPRRGKFSQLIPAILLYIVYGNFLFLGRTWVRKGIIGFDVGLWWLHGGMLLIAVALMIYRRVKNAYP
jgi:lipopolysaccharide export system permease protein